MINVTLNADVRLLKKERHYVMDIYMIGICY